MQFENPILFRHLYTKLKAASVTMNFRQTRGYEWSYSFSDILA